MKQIKTVLLFFFCACLVCAFTGCATSYSANEEHAISCVKNMKSYCKAPSSFELNGDVLIFTVEDSSLKGATICVFDYSAQNSYGVLLADDAIFCNGKYWGSEDDICEQLEKDKEERKEMDSIEEKNESLENTIAVSEVLAEMTAIQCSIDVFHTIPDNAEVIPEQTVVKALK